jgi:ABC-2 type transport system ATP-binding protein
VFSTHILSDLERVAFNVAFLAEGRIALHAPLDALIDTCLRLAGSAAEIDAWCAAYQGRVLARQALPDGREQALVRAGSAAPLAGQAQGLRIDRVTLEDLFTELTR